jgi:tetratricopeptide (TPR) repeat protein
VTTPFFARVAAGFALAATLAVIGTFAARATSTLDAGMPAPSVTPSILGEALASTRPERPTLSDEIDHFRRRLSMRPDDGLARARLVRAHLLRFRAYGDLVDLEAAERHQRERERRSGASPALLVDRSALQLVRHEFPQAVATARAAVRREETLRPELDLRLFDALWAVGRRVEADAILTLPLDTTSVAWMGRQARVLDRRGEVERARDLFRDVLASVRAFAEPAPVEAWALVELGHFEHHAGDPTRAVARYREALRVLPGSPAALEGLAAVAYGVDRDLDVARRLYGRALEQGAHLDVMPVLADVEEEAGDHAAAERTRAAFVRLATSTPLAERWYRRPLVFVLAGREDTACRALALARRDLEERRDPGAWDALAWALHRAGDPVAAWRAAREGLEGGAPEPGAAYRAGLVALAAGEANAAGRLLDLALAGRSELSPGEERSARRAREGGGAVPAPARLACDGRSSALR